jgi:hypothetical protein
MKALISAGISAVLLGVATPALAFPSTTLGQNQPEDKIVCKRLEMVGTRLGGKRICKKASEWKDDAAMHKDELDREQRQLIRRPDEG